MHCADPRPAEGRVHYIITLPHKIFQLWQQFSDLFLLRSSMSMAFILESRNKITNACSDPARISCALNDRLEESRLFPECYPFMLLCGQTLIRNRATLR